MAIKELPPEALRRFIRQSHEKEYALIDVRQPGEYEQGHIPGARLLPLSGFFQTMETLPTDKALVFYCHGGGRSMAAATMVEEEALTAGEIYNLQGGMLAWDGGMVADYPQVRLFDASMTSAEMMRTAVNLEKGAMRFYIHVHGQHGGQDWAGIFAALSKAERGHAKAVFGYWQQMQKDLQDFETVFNGLSGELLEGGASLADAIDTAGRVKGRVCIRLIELALQIEHAAFDLYRTMADQAAGADAREAFLSLAQSEKAHMRSLAAALTSCPLS